ncbi:MAG: hypothetical protein LC623_02570, partial [Halobacteriales archaeon]|nr:hypothetical protein [Halobacteriales archaeon]
ITASALHGSGTMKSPAGSVAFQVVPNQEQHLEQSSGPGQFDLSIDEFATSSLGLIWYVVAA